MMPTRELSAEDAINLFIHSEVSLPRPLRFWLMLLVNVPSVICAVCLIAYILINRAQRYALHNHTILLILLIGLPVQLMDINFYLIFFHYGSVLPSTPLVCRLWWLADYGFVCGGLILMAWLSVERHILIFHDRWLSNARGRFQFHYLPLIFLVAYILIFYMVVNFFLPCESTYEYSVPVCGASPCYQSYGILGTWEFLVNSVIPIFLEGIATVGLVARVHCQRRRLQQSNRWRKQRRMIIQLMLVSSMNVTLNTPVFFIPFLRSCGLALEYAIQPELYFFFFGYFVIFLFPFASLCQYPHFRKAISKRIVAIYRYLRQTATVAPAATATAAPAVTMTAAPGVTTAAAPESTATVTPGLATIRMRALR